MPNRNEKIIKAEIFPFLPATIQRYLAGFNKKFWDNLEEIRLRINKPLIFRVNEEEFTLDSDGNLKSNFDSALTVSADDIFRCISSISDNSLYAFGEEIKRGFITIPGGHRVGLAGQVVMDRDEVLKMTNFSGIAIRVAREIKNCALTLLPCLYAQNLRVNNMLIISPPRCGKTTMLRDITRFISNGNSICGGYNVALIDERSEIAGSYQGVAQLDVGYRTDVLDACPKAKGMIMAIRSLSPAVLVTDEIGRKEDIDAIEECIRAGVSIISSVHALDLEEVMQKPTLKHLLSSGAFNYLVFLSRRRGPGSIEKIVRWEEICSI